MGEDVELIQCISKKKTAATSKRWAEVEKETAERSHNDKVVTGGVGGELAGVAQT